jgi:ubiquinone/menaquinone biosynthesis C-methylase UbiE
MGTSEYEGMAAYYDVMLEPMLASMRRRIVAMAEVRQGMKVLEVACGTGAQAVRFKKAGADFTGVDLSAAMLEVAGRKKLECLHADGTNLPLPDAVFDLSTISLALHEVDPEIRQRIVEEMVRVTKPGGILLLADYAASARKDPYSRLAGATIHLVEKMVGGSHYSNYQVFMASGALDAFTRPFGLEPAGEQRIFGGNIALLKLRRPAG